MTRQRAWQLRKQQLGLCDICGRKHATNGTKCQSCFKRHRISTRLRERARKGCRIWRPGGPGRPPL